MRRDGAAGFTLVEMVIAAALLCVVTAVLLQLAAVSQQAVAREGDLADLQQRLRVAAAALHADLLAAGAGPTQGPMRVPLGDVLPAIRPSRTGDRNPDPDVFHAGDRFTVLQVEDTRAQTALAADVAGPGAPLVIEAAWPGCPADGSCGFAPGDRALVFDAALSGAYDIFTIASADGGLISAPAGVFWSHAYPRGSPLVVVRQRVYWLDRATRRLMVYNGEQSEAPFIDNVADLQLSYFAGPVGGAMTAAELTSGPVRGSAPNRFDTDLLRIRRVRVAMTLEAPGPGRGLDARLRRRQVLFDVTPRNAREP